MKKALLSVLTILCLCGLSAYAGNTNSTTTSTEKPSVKTMGQPPQNGRVTGEPAQAKPDQKPDKKPDKKPDRKPSQQPASKPGGDMVPPEFQSSK